MEELKKYIKIQHRFSSWIKWIMGFIFFMYFILVMAPPKREGISISMAIMSVYLGFFLFAWCSFVGFTMSLHAMMFFRVSRKNYYISSLCYCGLLSSGFALLLNLLLFLEYRFFTPINLEELKIFGVFFKYGNALGMTELFIFNAILFSALLVGINLMSILFLKIGPRVLVIYVVTFLFMCIGIIHFGEFIDTNMKICSLAFIGGGLSLIFSVLGWKTIKSLSIRV